MQLSFQSGDVAPFLELRHAPIDKSKVFLQVIQANSAVATDYVRHGPSRVGPLWQSLCISTGQMLPSSHGIPMDALMEVPQIDKSELTDAFAAFIGAANRLEGTHRHLHEEVAELRQQLEERNRALASSVAENERMRIALRQILDALPCGVAVFDMQFRRVILLNPEARRLLDIAKPVRWNNLPKWLQSAVNNVSSELREDGHEQEVLIEKDGSEVWLTMRYSLMTSPARQVQISDNRCMVVILTDVSAHKSAEREREQSRNAVALAEMAAVLAHEIRNPLGSLELLTGCLAGDVGLGDESKRCVQHLRAGIRSLSATVNNVLCFHNPGAQQMSPLELGSAVKLSVEFIRPLAQQRGVSLALQESLNNAEIIGDSNALRQLILNLACNALRHTPPGGEIRVSAALDGKGHAIVEVCDTGSGIRAEDLPHIFNIGFTTTGETPGLGLTICQRIMEQHRGVISVRSELGKGATFRMEFPVR